MKIGENKMKIIAFNKSKRSMNNAESEFGLGHLGMYLLMGILVASGVGGMLYYKKMKEAAELREFEEAEDIDYEDDLMTEKEETPALFQLKVSKDNQESKEE